MNEKTYSKNRYCHNVYTPVSVPFGSACALYWELKLIWCNFYAWHGS